MTRLFGHELLKSWRRGISSVGRWGANLARSRANIRPLCSSSGVLVLSYHTEKRASTVS